MPTIGTIKEKELAETLDETDEQWRRFWDLYPKKFGKQTARITWIKLSPSKALVDKICAAIEVLKKSRDWVKEGGKYIPYPSTFLNGRRWEDLPPSAMQSAESNVKMITRDHTKEGAKIPVARRPKSHDIKDPT